MSKKRYVVQAVEGFNGIELLADSPVGRHIYGPGELVELDDKQHDVVGLKGRGLIVDYAEPFSERTEEV